MVSFKVIILLATLHASKPVLAVCFTASVSLFMQMEAKVIMSRLLQQFRISLPEGYELRETSNTTLQPKGNVPCTLTPA